MASKRRCLFKLAGTKYVMDSALSSVLQKLADAEIDLRSLPIGRRSISRAVTADVAVPTEHGPVLSTLRLPQVNGAEFKWVVVNPAALLCWLCKFSIWFEAAFASKHRENPSNCGKPWHGAANK